MRRDWRWALGRDDAWEGFDPIVLCNFRKRLVAHGWERRIFEHVLGRLRELGLLAGRRRVRVDATALVADVARLSRPELIGETLRVSVCALWDGHRELHQHPTLVQLHEQYGEECWLGRGSEGAGRLSDLGRDGYLLLELMAQVAESGSRVVERRELLARVLAENFVRDEHGEVRVLEEAERPGDRLVRPHDPDARVGKKGGHLWTGDKVHVVETADDSGDNFVVDMLVTDARAEDSTVTGEIMERTRFVAPAAQLVVADGSYASAGNSRAAQGLGLELVSPPRAGNSRGLLPVTEFTLDFGCRRAICPAGQGTERWYPQGRGIRIRFAAAVCAACVRRAECTTSKNGRTLHISRDYQQLVRDRKRAGRPEFARAYRRRAGGGGDHLGGGAVLPDNPIRTPDRPGVVPNGPVSARQCVHFRVWPGSRRVLVGRGEDCSRTWLAVRRHEAQVEEDVVDIGGSTGLGVFRQLFVRSGGEGHRLRAPR